MNLFGMMDTSGEAMQAERMRAEVVAANMANAETTRTAQGGPYRRQHGGVRRRQGDPEFLDSMTRGGELASRNRLRLRRLCRTLPLRGQARCAPGVHIAQVVEDPAPPLKRYDPGHPDAGPDGYVAYPDINPLTEMVDLMGATRAYGLNGSAVQAEKGMITSALEIAKT